MVCQFGPILFWPILFFCVLLWLVLVWESVQLFVFACVCVVCCVSVLLCAVCVCGGCVQGLSAGPPSAGPPSAGPPKISLFCFPSPATVFILFSLSCWSFSLNFGGVFEDRDPQMCTFGLLGCRVKPRQPHQTGPPGLAHDSPRTPNVHISGHLRFKTPPKFHEKTPRETQKERNGGG